MNMAAAGARITKLGLACLAAAAHAAETTNEWRVLAVHPACFDYALTSVVTPSDPNPRLAFNHLSGRTIFARVGETVGPHRLQAYSCRTQNVFDATLNTTRTRVTGFATLDLAGGGRVTLEQGRPLTVPGWIASLICLTNATRWLVRPGSELPGPWQVAAVLSNEVFISRSTVTQQVATLSETERESLVRQWTAQAAAPPATPAAEEAAPEQDAPPVRRWDPPGQRALAERRERRIYVGGDYPWPTEFYVIPPVFDRHGRLVRPQITIPTRFERRRMGSSLSVSRD